MSNPPNTGIQGSNILTVTAPDGHVISNGEVTVDGASLSMEADIDHDGMHTVQWRAVSAHGHPIEGTFSFTYIPEEAGPETASPAVTSGIPAAAATQASSPAPTETAATTTTQSQPADMTGWLIAAGVIIVGLAAAVVYLMTRRNKTGTPG